MAQEKERASPDDNDDQEQSQSPLVGESLKKLRGGQHGQVVDATILLLLSSTGMR
jgi:hypothetical protein